MYNNNNGIFDSKVVKKQVVSCVVRIVGKTKDLESEKLFKLQKPFGSLEN